MGAQSLIKSKVCRFMFDNSGEYQVRLSGERLLLQNHAVRFRSNFVAALVHPIYYLQRKPKV